MAIRTVSYGLAAAVALAGCTGLIGDGGDDASKDKDKTGDDTAALCAEAHADVGETPLRRLTQLEYKNAVSTLLEVPVTQAAEFVPDEVVGGFAANSVSALSDLQVEQYMNAAEDLAAAAYAAHKDTWFACDVNETSCVSPKILDLAHRAFRAPVDDALGDSLIDLYESARSQWDADMGIQMAISAILASLHFLYHLEVDSAGADGVLPVTAHELASRMSFFLWQSIPDDVLLAAAASGELDTPEGVAGQVRRMIADDKAQETINSFHSQWLELQRLDELVKDDTMFPNWSNQLADSMRSETLAFTSHIVNEGLPASEMFSGTYSFINEDLASIYGESVTGNALVETQLDPTERAGILTQAAFLASRAHAADTSWVLRGKFVREKVFCQHLPSPPPGVDQASPNDPDRLNDPECGTCHQMMDPIGFGFEKYDALGQFRTEFDDGTPIDDSGEVVDNTGTLEVGTFQGAVGLADELKDNEQALRCVTTQWFRYAKRRLETDHDTCSIEAAHTQFAEANYDIRELLVAIATSDAFRHRREGSN